MGTWKFQQWVLGGVDTRGGLLRRGKKGCRKLGVRDTTGKPTEASSLTHGNSQGLHQQQGGISGLILGYLHVCDHCVAWSLCGTPDNRNRGCPQCFGWLLGTYFSCWIDLPSLNTAGDAWAYGSLISHALLKLLGVLPLYE